MRTSNPQKAKKTDSALPEKKFKQRQIDFGGEILKLYNRIYHSHPDYKEGYLDLLKIIESAFTNRPGHLKKRDLEKINSAEANWFLSNRICGMSLYVDRFCGTLPRLKSKLNYFKRLGINFLHLMPVFESPANESDGGYAVSNFRKIDPRFGKLEDLENLQQKMQELDMYLMLVIVLNHTSQQHEWARKARAGEKKYQDYFYFFADRKIPDEFGFPRKPRLERRERRTFPRDHSERRRL